MRYELISQVMIGRIYSGGHQEGWRECVYLAEAKGSN